VREASLLGRWPCRVVNRRWLADRGSAIRGRQEEEWMGRRPIVLERLCRIPARLMAEEPRAGRRQWLEALAG
jgi:hypothetical protein